MKNKISQIAMLLMVLVLSSSAFSQATDNGGLEGTVYDPQAAVVPNATVTVRNVSTGLTRKTVSAAAETAGSVPKQAIGFGLHNLDRAVESTLAQGGSGTPRLAGKSGHGPTIARSYFRRYWEGI